MVSEYVEFWNEELEDIESQTYLMSEGLYSEEKYWISYDCLLVGKLGEEAIKSRLASLITDVDYEVYRKSQGDGGIDFRISSDLSIGIQVKTKSEKGVGWYFGITDLISSQIFIFSEVRTYINGEYADIEILGFLTSDILLEIAIEAIEEGFLDKNKLLVHNKAFLDRDVLGRYLENFFSLEEASYLKSFDAVSVREEVFRKLRSLSSNSARTA